MKKRDKKRAGGVYRFNREKAQRFFELFIRALAEPKRDGEDTPARADRALRTACKQWEISFEMGLAILQMLAPAEFPAFKRGFFPHVEMRDPMREVLGLEMLP